MSTAVRSCWSRWVGRNSGVVWKSGQVRQAFGCGQSCCGAGRRSSWAGKLTGRENVGAMTFVCLYVDEDLHAVAPERLLITQYRGGGQVPWNTGGFGSNDPGQRRDTTSFEADHFDSLHPARLHWVCDTIAAGRYAADELLTALKEALPYLFRYQAAAFHRDMAVEVPHDGPTADELFQAIGQAVAAYDDRWQITALPGYVIMYPSHGPYPSARKTYP
jgi:hypothetical protein